MDFFGDYSIATASSHRASAADWDRGHDPDLLSPSVFPPPSPVSPRDVRQSLPAPVVNLHDLARQFSLQQLDTSAPPTDDSAPPSPDYITSTSHSLEVPASHVRRGSVSSRNAPCWKRRQQRQRDARMMIDVSHLRTISELVQRMVDTGEQCGVRRPDLLTPRDLLPTPPTPSVGEADFDSLDSGSPRSLSSSSSISGRRPSYFNADFHNHAHRRQPDPVTISASLKDSKVHKVRARKGARR